MDDVKQRRANRLIHETSPYLLQHAYNPVDWYPWGEEALAEAKRANKPILLSIGYSACHWCHVMEKESFEDPDIAAIMNEHFVNIKVDREERPDLDQIYQSAAQLLSSQGGWPLTVFLTPDQRPFFAGTYFPREDRHGRPGFGRVLQLLIRMYRSDPGRIEKTAVQVMKALHQLDVSARQPQGVPQPEDGSDLLRKSIQWLENYFDEVNGGFGTQPKFANTPVLEFLLRQVFRARSVGTETIGKQTIGTQTIGTQTVDTQNGGASDDKILNHYRLTLDRMYRGGVYDQLGGGFHRYSVDDRWLVPHFEKMLYDNALLVMTYLQGYQLTGSADFKTVVQETFDYIEREMTHPEGGFYSAQDADFEGEEGKFYVWDLGQLEEVVGPEVAPIIADRFGVTESGNFDRGTTVLHQSMGPQDLARKYRMSESQVQRMIDEARQKLLASRDKRVKPLRDEKIITSWNALMISAYSRAFMVLDEQRYIQSAEKAASFIRKHLIRDDRLMRSFKERPSGTGYLEDYAFWVQALIDLYEATFDRTYLDEAVTWMDRTIELFWDDTSFGFFLTPSDHEQLIYRPKDWRDQSIPSGTGVSVINMIRLHGAADDKGYQTRAHKVLQGYHRQLDQNPWVTATLLTGYDLIVHGLTEVIIVAAEHQLDRAREFARIYGTAYVPGVLHLIDPTEAESDAAPLLWRGKRQVDDAVTAYVCRGFTCTAPMTDPADVARVLKNGGSWLQ